MTKNADIHLQYHKYYMTHAVAFNNFGVTLLEKKCYGQALDTLRDSLSLIQKIVNDSNEVCPNSCILQHHKVSDRISNPCVSKHKILHIEAIELFSESISTYNPAFTNSSDPIDSQLSLNGTFHPIRLDNLYHSTDYDVTKTPTNEMSSTLSFNPKMVELEASIIMHNLGIAYFGMSILCSGHNPHNVIKYQANALQMLRKSYGIYANVIQDRTCINNDIDLCLRCFQTPFYFRGMTILLNNLIQLMIHIHPNHYNINEIEYYISVKNRVDRKVMDVKLWNEQLGMQSIAAIAT